MERNERLMLLLGALLIVVVVVGYYFLLLNPLREEYNQRVEEREQKEAQLVQLQQEVQELEAIQRRAPEIERQLLELSKRIPDQAEIPSLLVQVEEISNAAGVTQLSIQPEGLQPPLGGGDFQRIPVTMSFEGTYVQMQDFLRRVQNLARLMTVNEVTYDLAEEGEETTGAAQPRAERLIQVEISAEVYVQPSAGPSGPAPLAPPPVPEPSPTEDTTGETTGV